MLRYFRAHGLGNDYIVLDLQNSRLRITPSVMTRICDRHEGIGGDGALVARGSEVADFGVTIYNPDGSQAEKSGNGVRIFARYLVEEGLLHQSATLETAGGIVRLSVHHTDGRLELEADMGRPSFVPSSLPMRWEAERCLEQGLDLTNGERVVGSAVSMGNPHFVMFTDRLEEERLLRQGPLLEHHPLFPNRTNVQLAHVLSPQQVVVRIWERGAGPTRASGSSACAVVAAGIVTGRLESQVAVHMPGGVLKVRQDERGHIHQRGPVGMISRGTVAPELEAAWIALGEERED